MTYPPLFQAHATRETDPERVAAELASALPGAGLVLYFASTAHAMDRLARAVRGAFPWARTAGCSTMGEIGALGLTTGGLSAAGLGGELLVGAAMLNLRAFHFDDGAQLVLDLSSQLGLAPSQLSPTRHVFVTLTDGLSGREEILVASLNTHAPGIPLVGGSAGDDFRMEHTWVALDGHARTEGAVVLLLEPRVPFHAFHGHHFHPTDERVVVTRADPERRLVQEINGYSAVEVIAGILDVPEEYLREEPHEALVNNPVTLGFRVGGEVCLRTVMSLRGDDVILGGAVSEGSVLRVMAAGDLVGETASGLERALDGLGVPPAGQILFSCGGRLWEAESEGLLDDLAAAMTGVPTAGFTTYGEQFGPLQVNHTLTGLLLGGPRG